MDTSFLEQVGCVLRVSVPNRLAREFWEHFPLYEDDEKLPSSGELSTMYDYVIYVHQYVPRKEQIAYILRFPYDHHLTETKFLWWSVTPEEIRVNRGNLYTNSQIRRKYRE